MSGVTITGLVKNGRLGPDALQPGREVTLTVSPGHLVPLPADGAAAQPQITPVPVARATT